MSFTSIKFLIFFIVICFGYFLLNKKLKIYWLLLGSYFFYMSWNPKYALLMLFSTIVTYLSGILISKSKSKKEKKIWVALSIIINLLILAIFKYYSFIIDNLSSIFTFINLPKTLNVLLPVGISFYTFQALSYTIDVYRNDVAVEKNFARYALFVSFFPQLVAGPIEKSKDLLKQFNQEHKFNWDNLKNGLLLMGVGFFYKLVLSVRAALVVNQVYNNLQDYMNGGGLYLIIATILFAFQIYFDFNAYSIIAKGSAKVLGYELTTNFNKPYFATSVKDFWRRWHISLSSWFREYLYFPLGGSRKGFWRTQINIFIVFLVSGLWHGAAWTFVIWGIIHGVYQIIENIFRKLKSSTNKNAEIDNSGINKKRSSNLMNIVIKGMKMLATFIAVDFAWIFFRANSIQDAFTVITHLFKFGAPLSKDLLGIDLSNVVVLVFTLFITFLLEAISTKHSLKTWLNKRNIVIRWTIYYLIIFSIIIFGIYGPGYSAQEFIYFQF